MGVAYCGRKGRGVSFYRTLGLGTWSTASTPREGSATIISRMADLAAKTCMPSRGGVPPLKGDELLALQMQVDDSWRVVEEHHITKTFTFPNFREALTFVNRVGELAE